MDHTKQPLTDIPQDSVDDGFQRVSVMSARSAPPISPGYQDSIPTAEEELKDETVDLTIKHLAEDIEECYDNKTPLFDTYFYKVVLGGNVEVVKRTVQHLETHSNKRVLSWLLDIGCAQQRKMYTPIAARSKLRVVRWVVFFFSALLSLITSPVFYCLHGLSCTLLEHRKRGISNRISLPLAFAAFSHSREMVEYFFRKTIRASFTDEHDNNVFHYIGDLASESSSNACIAFDILIEALYEQGESEDFIKEVLFEQQNSQGLSALEYTSRYGSPALLTKMMNCQCLMRNTQFRVMPKCVNLKAPPKAFAQPKATREAKDDHNMEVKIVDGGKQTISLLQHQDNNKEDKDKKMTDDKDMTEKPISSVSTASSQSTSKSWGDATTRVDFVDVTTYESHLLTKRSLLLRLIGSRNIGETSVTDLLLFQKCPVVGKWIQLKVAEMKKYIVAFHMLDIIVTALLFVLLAFLKGSLPYQLKESSNFFSAHLGEVVARQNNNSFIITPEAMDRTMQRTIQEKQLEWSIDCLNDDTLTDIINSTGNPAYNLANGTSGQELRKNKSMAGYLLPSDLQDNIIYKAFDNMAHSKEEIFFQDLFHITVLFSQQILAKYPDFPLIRLTEKNVEKLEELAYEFYGDFQVEIKGETLKPHDYFSTEEWGSLFCPSVVGLTLDDFITKVTVPPPPSQATDICRWQSLVTMAEESCKPDTPTRVYSHLEYLLQLQLDNEKIVNVLVYVMLGFAVGYILIDTFEHLRFFYGCIQVNQSVLGMVQAVLTWPIPGSYYRKQLNVITYYVLILHVCVQDNNFVAMYFSNDYVSKVTHQMLLIGLCLRFIMHIHALRLYPWIGHFVITTFRMATNLIHFSTVLGLVVFVFGLIFHILIVDENCPIRKDEGFTGIGISMFSVFKLTFGHGEFDPYYTNTPTMMAYALFTVICSLLLLNLIIAIMSTTAMDIMTPEGKEALGKVEWLNESLAAEYTVIVLASMRGNPKWIYRDHARAGYVVTKQRKVYIRVFYCPKLD